MNGVSTNRDAARIFAAWRRPSLALVAAFAVAGCEVVDLPGEGAPPPTLYVLNAPMAAPAGVGPALGVDTPKAAAGLDTPRMLARTGPNALTPIARAAWVEPVGPLLGEYLVAAMEASGRFALVGPITAGLSYDRGLYVDIRRFEIDTVNGGQSAEVRLRARLVDLRARRVVKARSFDGSAPLSGGGPAASAAAFQAAVDAATAELAAWAATPPAS
ncbi:MAG: ABC-type transport auxiliary lipoprotein family protein [Pseudomonadota bacterium]